MIKHLYLIPTMQCNLHCPHCFIAGTPEVFNKDKFIEQMNSFNGTLSLFGGEVTSNIERMKFIISNNDKYGINKIGSVSTNLIFLDDYLLEYYKKINSIATSWNPNRFHSPYLFNQWINNLKVIQDNDIKHTILVTLTSDLISMNKDEFFDKISKFDSSKSIIRFEHYVGNVESDHFGKCDDWLCEIYSNWNLNSKFGMEDHICKWMYNCNEIYTLFPDGKIINRCPHNLPSVIPDECYNCERIEICQPCRLLKFCSFPHKLNKLIQERRKNEK